jgi:hypothetical protein
MYVDARGNNRVHAIKNYEKLAHITSCHVALIKCMYEIRLHQSLPKIHYGNSSSLCHEIMNIILSTIML